jgi:short-subunit dehydrogenase
MEFTDQVVVVTGAASGIGQELCRLFARRSAKIGLIDRDKSKLDAFADELRRDGVPSLAVGVDVREREQLQAAVRHIAGTLGPIDILVPSAGVCRASTPDDLRISDVEEIVRTNFLGMVYLIETVLPSMLERKSGHIVGLSSLAGLRGLPFEPAYSASKAALAVYLESLRSELSLRGIAVTIVFPGFVQTPLLNEINGMMGADMSSGKAFMPEAAAARIMRGIERGSPYVYFPRLLGLSVRLSRLMPPRLYDRTMRRMFRRFSISRKGGAAPDANES